MNSIKASSPCSQIRKISSIYISIPPSRKLALWQRHIQVVAMMSSTLWRRGIGRSVGSHPNIICTSTKILHQHNIHQRPKTSLHINSLQSSAVSATVHTNGNKKDKKPLWFYNNKAIRKRKIDQLLRQTCATNQTLSDDASHLKRLMQVLEDYGFTDKDVGMLLYTKPKLLEVSKNKLQKRLTGFLMLNLPHDVIKRMVEKCPSILFIDQESVSLQNRLNFLQELPLHPRLTQEKCLYLVQKCPQVFLIDNKSNLRSKIRNLAKFDLNSQQLYQLVMKHPSILTYSESAVDEKCKYIKDVMGARISLLMKFPRVLSSSLQRIRERHEYLVNEGYMSANSYISENKLRAIVLPTDNDFVYRITNTKMKDFRAFQATVTEKYSKDSDGVAEIADQSNAPDLIEDPNNEFKESDETEVENISSY